MNKIYYKLKAKIKSVRATTASTMRFLFRSQSNLVKNGMNNSKTMNDRNRITEITLHAGRSAGLPHQKFQPGPITIFVGPNFSGKSQVLRELSRRLQSGEALPDEVILQDIHIDKIDPSLVETAIDDIRLTVPRGTILPSGAILIGGRGTSTQIREDILRRVIEGTSTIENFFYTHYLQYKVLMLDGASRVTLIQPQPMGELTLRPQNSLQALFRNDLVRAQIQTMFHEAFGSHLFIDPSRNGQFSWSVSHISAMKENIERSLSDQALNFFEQCLPLVNSSDGMKAFVGILAEVYAGNPDIVLIDEPEAFLHPPLAYKLGYELARSANITRKQVFASTHSPHFLIGCIQSDVPVNIIRLTFKSGVATARILSNSAVRELMRKPLLRSTGLLNALFYESVVVTESDTDRVFYQEINERLLRHKPERGIPNCLFINAQNKQTLEVIIRPLREMGLPVLGIADIDLVKCGGGEWTKICTAVGMPSAVTASLAILRSTVKTYLEATEKDMKLHGGIYLLSGAELESAKYLVGELKKYGLFVVPLGELENWLQHLSVAGKKTDWLVAMFERMGDQTEDPNYVFPADDDVWDFMYRAKQWLQDPHREGIPN